MRANRDGGHSFNVADAFDLNRNILLRDRGNFDRHNLATASATGAGRGRFLTEKSPGDNQQRDENHNARNLDNTSARFVGACSSLARGARRIVIARWLWLKVFREWLVHFRADAPAKLLSASNVRRKFWGIFGC